MMIEDKIITCEHKNFTRLEEFEPDCFTCKCLDCGENFVKVIPMKTEQQKEEVIRENFEEVIKEFWEAEDYYGYSTSKAVKGGDMHDIEFAKELIDPKLHKALDTIYQQGMADERDRIVDIAVERAKLWKEKGFEIRTLIDALKIIKLEEDPSLQLHHDHLTSRNNNNQE